MHMLNSLCPFHAIKWTKRTIQRIRPLAANFGAAGVVIPLSSSKLLIISSVMKLLGIRITFSSSSSLSAFFSSTTISFLFGVALSISNTGGVFGLIGLEPESLDEDGLKLKDRLGTMFMPLGSFLDLGLELVLSERVQRFAGGGWLCSPE